MRGAFGKQRNHNKEETILNITLLALHISVENKQEQPIPYHRRTVPAHTVPIHTNTIHTYIPSGQLRRSFFFSSSLLFLSSPSCLSFSLLQSLTLSVSISDTLFSFIYAYPSILRSSCAKRVLSLAISTPLFLPDAANHRPPST